MIRSILSQAIAFVPAALLLGACSNPLTGTESSSCDQRAVDSAKPQCVDYTSVALGQSAFKTSCQTSKGIVGERCDRTGALGGCNQKNTDGQGNDETRWYYPGTEITSVDDVKKECTSGTFVTP